MVLHTFGRDLKWNPHIHCLISEGGYSDDAFWRNVSHSTILSFAMRFRTALLKGNVASHRSFFSKKFLPVVIWNMNTASMFMPSPTVVTLRLLPNILAGILVALSLPLPGSILIPVILSLSITIVTKMINTFKKPFLSWILSNALSGTSLKKHFKMIRYGGLYARHRSIDKKAPSRYFERKAAYFRCLTGAYCDPFFFWL